MLESHTSYRPGLIHLKVPLGSVVLGIGINLYQVSICNQQCYSSAHGHILVILTVLSAAVLLLSLQPVMQTQ